MIYEPLRVPLVIAEAGCNHQGDVGIAIEMVRAAASAGAWCIKFQKRNPRALLTPEQYAAPYISRNAFGPTYGEHREALELSEAEHRKIQRECARAGIRYGLSVWDVPSATLAAELSPDVLKVPSPCLVNWEMLEVIRERWDGMVHLSTGMSTWAEISRAVGILGNPERLVLYACVSAYPCAFEDASLLQIRELARRYSCKHVAYSGHHRGIAIDLGAAFLGARYIERHFTLDRSWPGSDHAISLEPAGLSRLIRDLAALSAAWRAKPGVLGAEVAARDKLQWRPHETAQTHS